MGTIKTIAKQVMSCISQAKINRPIPLPWESPKYWTVNRQLMYLFSALIIGSALPLETSYYYFWNANLGGRVVRETLYHPSETDTVDESPVVLYVSSVWKIREVVKSHNSIKI